VLALRQAGTIGGPSESEQMSMFNTGDGEKKYPQLNASLAEANLHALMSALASDYVKLLKKSVLPDLGLPKKYTIRDMQILSALFESGKPLTSTDIFKRTGLDPATVTRSTKILIADGYLESSENREDSRSRYLHLTNSGESLADKYHSGCEKLFESKDLSIAAPTLDEFQSIEKMLKSLRNRVRILNLKKF